MTFMSQPPAPHNLLQPMWNNNINVNKVYLVDVTLLFITTRVGSKYHAHKFQRVSCFHVSHSWNNNLSPGRGTTGLGLVVRAHDPR